MRSGTVVATESGKGACGDHLKSRSRTDNRNRRAVELGQEWLPWLETKRFLAPPEPMGVLQRLLHRSTGREPNGKFSAELAAFHLAVVSLEVGYLIPFLDVYIQSFPDPVKSLLIEVGVTHRSTFYDRAHKAAAEVIRTTNRLIGLNAAMKKETENLYEVSGFHPTK